MIDNRRFIVIKRHRSHVRETLNKLCQFDHFKQEFSIIDVR